MKRPKSPRIIIKEIQEYKYRQWSIDECKEAIEMLNKAQSVCVDVLTNILPNQSCGRQYFEQLYDLLEFNKHVCLEMLSINEKISTIHLSLI